MLVVPAAMPLTTPVKELTDAMVASAVLHAPPVLSLVSVIVAVSQTTVGPLIVATAGDAFTVTAAETLLVPQLLVKV